MRMPHELIEEWFVDLNANDVDSISSLNVVAGNLVQEGVHRIRNPMNIQWAAIYSEDSSLNVVH